MSGERAALMRAVAVSEFGGTPTLMRLPRPEPAEGELLVRLCAAAVNPFDFTIARGWVAERAPHVFPLVLGVDGAGVVEALGAGVERFAVGQAVYGAFLHPPYGRGTYACYAVVPEHAWIAPAPANIPLPHAAAAPSAGMSALALMHLARIREGETVLIVGAGGGVGSFALQLAAARGARVLATSRPDSSSRLRALGASDCIDYTRGALPEQAAALAPQGVHVLLDLVSDRAGFAANLSALADGGRAISTRYAVCADTPRARSLRLVNLDLNGEHASRAPLAALSALLDSGGLVVDIQAEIELSEMPAAIQRLVGRGARGKTIVRI